MSSELFYYSVIRFYPRTVTGERINVAMALWDKHGDSAFRVLACWGRVHAFAGDDDLVNGVRNELSVYLASMTQAEAYRLSGSPGVLEPSGPLPAIGKTKREVLDRLWLTFFAGSKRRES